MRWRSDNLSSILERIDAALPTLRLAPTSPIVAAIERWRSDAAAMRFHLRTSEKTAPITVILGGTGAGKSTLVNRLVGSNVSATSFRRTFTAGPLAVLGSTAEIPPDWLAVPHLPAAASDLPTAGQSTALLVIRLADASLSAVLVDTPDLDGDQPAHHAQAERAFRWGQRLLFVVTPEKYQMTELLPYYRLARRYEIPALFVMNKCEQTAVAEDFRRQLAGRDWPEAQVFIIPRDDAAYEPPPQANLLALREAIAQPIPINADLRRQGNGRRAADISARLSDQVLNPLLDARRQSDLLIADLRAMESPSAGIDVNPITQQLQRRLQQRSVLYLIGPQRMLDRLRQMPMLLARLPRATWDWVMGGHLPSDLANPQSTAASAEPPDFAALLADQFTLIRSRIDDTLRGNPSAVRQIDADPNGYAQSLIDPSAAGKIADDEIADLKNWLQNRWNATPRDTRILQSLLKYLPGGKKLTEWSEAAPYLLTLILVAHHAFFGHIDLMVLGGYSLATWITERLSNEVSSRTCAANRQIALRFAALAHDQIDRTCQWLDQQVPPRSELAKLQKQAAELASAAQE